MVVENAGFGAGAAAPIARRVFDYVLAGQYPSEADIAATQLGQSTAPIGTPRPIDVGAAAGRDRRRRGDGARRRSRAAAASAPRRAVPERPAAREQVALRPQLPMSAVFESPSLWQRTRPIFTGFDGPLRRRRRCCSPPPAW